jgi:hypothetical protein
MGRAPGRHVCCGPRQRRGRRTASANLAPDRRRDDGPFVAAMPAAALVLRARQDLAPEAGARPATGEVQLKDLEPLFAAKAIHAGCRDGERKLRSTAACWERAGPACPNPSETCTKPSKLALYRRGKCGTGPVPSGQLRRRRDRVSGGRSGRSCARSLRGTARQGDLDPDLRGADVPQQPGRGAGALEGLVVERFGPMAFGLALWWRRRS